MKKVFLVVVTMVFISKGIIFAQSTGTVTLEEYVPKVIVEAKFGNSINEFGFHRQSKGHEYPDMGPNAIVIDSHGNIYILDSVNERIVIYNENGEYKSNIFLKSLKRYKIFDPFNTSMAIDSSGTIYILTTHLDFMQSPVVIELNKQGKFVKQYFDVSKLKKYTTEVEPSRKNQFIQMLNNIQKSENTKILSDDFGEIRNLSTEDGNVYIVTKKNYYLRETNNKIEKLHFKGNISLKQKYIYERNPKITDYSKVEPIENVIVKDLQGNIIRILNLELPPDWQKDGWKLFNAGVSFEDIFNNKYVGIVAEKKSETGTLYSNDFTSLIYKYNEDWELISIIRIKVDDPIYRFLSPIDKMGNIYQLVWNSKKLEEGVKVIKWKVKK